MGAGFVFALIHAALQRRSSCCLSWAVRVADHLCFDLTCWLQQELLQLSIAGRKRGQSRLLVRELHIERPERHSAAQRLVIERYALDLSQSLEARFIVVDRLLREVEVGVLRKQLALQLALLQPCED